jgi:hypothetical protein
MKIIIGALALLVAAPAVAQSAASSVPAHQHGMEHKDHAQGTAAQDCCRDGQDCCKQGQKCCEGMDCCKHEGQQGGAHEQHRGDHAS